MEVREGHKCQAALPNLSKNIPMVPHQPKGQHTRFLLNHGSKTDTVQQKEWGFALCKLWQSVGTPENP